MEDVLLRIGESTRSTASDNLRQSDGGRYAGQEDETEKLEEEVREISAKLKKYRSTLPAHLNSTLSSILISQRPQDQKSSSDNSNEMSSADGDEKAGDDAELLKDKISSNISVMPIILNRINECISRIDELVSSNETTYAVLKWKKS